MSHNQRLALIKVIKDFEASEKIPLTPLQRLYLLSQIQTALEETV